MNNLQPMACARVRLLGIALVLLCLALFSACESSTEHVPTTATSSTATETSAAPALRYTDAVVRTVARNNGVSPDTAERIFSEIYASTHTLTREGTRAAMVRAITCKLDITKMPQLAKLAENLTVTNPDLTADQILRNMLQEICQP